MQVTDKEISSTFEGINTLIQNYGFSIFMRLVILITIVIVIILLVITLIKEIPKFIRFHLERKRQTLEKTISQQEIEIEKLKRNIDVLNKDVDVARSLSNVENIVKILLQETSKIKTSISVDNFKLLVNLIIGIDFSLRASLLNSVLTSIEHKRKNEPFKTNLIEKDFNSLIMYNTMEKIKKFISCDTALSNSVKLEMEQLTKNFFSNLEYDINLEKFGEMNCEEVKQYIMPDVDDLLNNIARIIIEHYIDIISKTESYTLVQNVDKE